MPGKHWSKEEIIRLMGWYDKHLTYKRIARLTGRSRSAVNHQVLWQLKLRRRGGL